MEWDMLGKTAKLYGVAYGSDQDSVKLGRQVWTFVCDPSDGYRSYCEDVRKETDTSIGPFLRNAVATVTVRKWTECDIHSDADPEGFQLVDADGHVWLTVGTDYSDDYYPSYTFHYTPIEAPVVLSRPAEVVEAQYAPVGDYTTGVVESNEACRRDVQGNWWVNCRAPGDGPCMCDVSLHALAGAPVSANAIETAPVSSPDQCASQAGATEGEQPAALTQDSNSAPSALCYRCPECGDPVYADNQICPACTEDNPAVASAAAPAALDETLTALLKAGLEEWVGLETTTPYDAILASLYRVVYPARCLVCNGEGHAPTQCPEIARERLRQEREARAGRAIARQMREDRARFLLALSHAGDSDRRAMAGAVANYLAAQPSLFSSTPISSGQILHAWLGMLS